jgi:hypothetical protein
MNNLGKIIHEEIISIHEVYPSFDLDLKAVEPGIYFIVVLENNIILTEKVIIK